VSATRSGYDVLRAATEGGEALPPCSALLGWRALSIEPGRVRAEFHAPASFCNPHGTVQGGFIAAMLDDAMGPAGFTLLDEGAFAPTLEMKVSYLRPARPGRFVGEGRVVQKSRGVLFLEGHLVAEDGTVVAMATATARIVAPGNGTGS
jgi:uncharacterized protein (TIGR00369 family)